MNGDLPRGTHVERDGLVHIVRMSKGGVFASGRKDLYAYWTECQVPGEPGAGEAIHIPYGTTVAVVHGQPTCIGCLAAAHPEGSPAAESADLW